MITQNKEEALITISGVVKIGNTQAMASWFKPLGPTDGQVYRHEGENVT